MDRERGPRKVLPEMPALRVDRDRTMSYTALCSCCGSSGGVLLVVPAGVEPAASCLPPGWSVRDGKAVCWRC